MPSLILVKAAFDEAGGWWVEHSDLPGLNLQAPTLEEFGRKLPGAVADLLEADGHTGALDVPIEIVAHVSARATGGAAAANQVLKDAGLVQAF